MTDGNEAGQFGSQVLSWGSFPWIYFSTVTWDLEQSSFAAFPVWVSMGRETSKGLIGKGVSGAFWRADFMKEVHIGRAPLAPVRLIFDFFFPVAD